MATTNLYHCDQCGATSSTPTTGWTCDHYWQQIDLVERFRTWRARNPRGIFAKTVDIRCVSDHQPDFTLTTRCDSHIIAALDGKSDPPCGVIRFRASAGYCNQCDDEFERDLDEIVPLGLTADTLDPHDITSICFDAWAGDAPLPEPFDFEEFSPVGRSIRDAIIADAQTDPAYKTAYVAALQENLDAVFDYIAYQEAHRYCDQFFHGDDGLYDFSDPQDDWSPREDDYNEERGY
jgi:hypothetical protein